MSPGRSVGCHVPLQHGPIGVHHGTIRVQGGSIRVRQRSACVRDTLALPLVSPRHAEEAARGAATLAAIAVGELSAAEATARLAHV